LTIYHQSLPTASDVLKKKFSFPPIMADRVKLVIKETDGQKTVLFKMELIGMASKKAYKANPIMDTKLFKEGVNINHDAQPIFHTLLI
jgi:hypothetical protein